MSDGKNQGQVNQEPNAEPKPASSVDVEAIKAKAAAAEAELQKLREADSKRRKEAKDKEEAEALKRGEHEKLLAQQKAELEASQKAIAEMQQMVASRVERNVSRLDEPAKKEYELLKDSLPLPKLDAWLEAKLGVQIAAPSPAPDPLQVGPKPRGGKKWELHPESVGLINDLAPNGTALRIGEKLGAFKINATDYKFRWKGTGDDRKDIQSFIGLLNGICPNPMRAKTSPQLEAVLKE